MPTVDSLLLPITYFTLGINAFVLIQSLVQKSQHHKFLALFFFASMINYLDDVYWLTDGWRWLPALTNAYIPFTFLIPVALYLYIKTLITPAQKTPFFNKHWLGFFIALLFCLPYYAMDMATKISRLDSAPGSLSHYGLITWGPIAALMLFIPFGLVYIILCIKIIKNNHSNVKDFFSNIEDKTLTWVRWALVILVLAWLVSSAELLLPSRISESSYWSVGFAVFELLWLWVFAYFAWQQKALTIPSLVETQKQPSPLGTDKYKRSPLTEKDVDRITAALTKAIDQQIHRKPELSLQTLSENTGIPVIKISQVLNVHLQTGFYDFINKNRIDDACQQLRKTQLNVIDIAYLVGFNSKSTFNKAFKKHSGLTPSQYRKQN